MRHAHLWADHGVTGEMLLGALVDAGASVETVDEAVRTLGVGDVRLAWARLDRGGSPAVLVRVRAPEETPDVSTWSQVRDILRFAALDDAVRDDVLAAAERLVRAEADAAGLPADDLTLPPVGVLDALATMVGACAAKHDLGIDRMTVGAIGVGSGTADTLLGEVEVPTPATRALLEEHVLESRGVPHELTTSVGAALIGVLARPGTPPDVPATRSGLGAGERVERLDAVLRLDLHDVPGGPA